MRMHRLAPRTSLATARRFVVGGTRPLARQEDLALVQAAGRVAALSVRARIHVPPFDSAHVDGYAMRACDVEDASAQAPVDLELMGEVHAGEVRRGRWRPGGSVAVATGAPVPAGADCVEMFERVEVRGKRLRVKLPVARGQYIDLAGADLERGTPLLRCGEVLGPAALGGLAAVGQARVRVLAKPRVAILSHGDELTLPGTPLPPGRVYESNTTVLSAIVQAGGGIAVPVPPVRDRPVSLERALRSALRTADAVVVSGGSSVGEHDYLGEVLPRLGRLLFHGILVRPGMPTVACRAGDRVVLGMPGHPASCMTNALWLLLPLVRRLGGYPDDGTRELEFTLQGDPHVHGSPCSTVVPLHLEGGKAWPTFRGSHFITSLAGANGFLIVSPSDRPPREGDRVKVQAVDFLRGG